MRIDKTNKVGIMIAERAQKFFSGFLDIVKEGAINNEKRHNMNGTTSDKLYEKFGESFSLRDTIFNLISKPKVLRVTKSVIDACTLIDFDDIIHKIDLIDLDFLDLIVLLDNDKSGVIKLTRVGTDIDFLYFKDLDWDNGIDKAFFDTFSFASKEFILNDALNLEENRFIIKLVTYLFYGDISTKFIPKKTSVKLSSFSKFVNNSKLNITYVNSLWKQRISTDGFNVRGHFRLQPFGEQRSKKRLIWIEEFKKKGYNRKATIESFNNGK